MSHRARILVIDNLAVESSRRGIYRILSERYNLDIHLLVPRDWKETTRAIKCEEERGGSLAIHVSGIMFGHRAHRVLYTKLHQIVRHIQPDIILAIHAPEHYATLQILLARRFLRGGFGIALFASRNIDLPKVGFPYKLAFLNQLCDWYTAREKVDAVFHRPAEYGFLYERYSDTRVYVPHHVDCSIFKPDTKVKSNMDVVTLAYVGRLVRAKGVHLLISALAQLPRNTVLRIIGEGDEAAHLHRLAARFGVDGQIKFEEPVRYAEMPKVFNSIDILILPSIETPRWKELFGRVLIEAMACGVPLVASATGGIPEVVGDGGVLFQSENIEDLASKLNGLVASPEKRIAIGTRGRERALRLFDTQVVAGTLWGGLAKLLPSGHAE